MKKIQLIALIVITISSILSASAAPAKKSKEYFEIRIYHLATKQQEATTDSFLQHALLPLAHRKGINRVGVFKPIGNDTAAVKRIFVLIPHKNFRQFEEFHKNLATDQQVQQTGNSYLNAGYKTPPYLRFETILLTAFKDMPQLAIPKLTASKAERVYELRSYEGHTEKIFKNKVDMFNKGGEVKLFDRLGFNAVFYGEVIAGSKMPNLMYMTSFENMQSRNDHWKSFGNDPEWKVLSAKPEYQNNVSKIDITFLRATDYSDL